MDTIYFKWLQEITDTLAYPGFPIGGANLVRGFQLPTWLRFVNVKTKELGSLWGTRRVKKLKDAIWIPYGCFLTENVIT